MRMNCRQKYGKITEHLDDDRDFSDVLDACKQQLQRSLSTVTVNSMCCMPGLRFWKLGRSTMWRLCARWFLEPNSNGNVKTRIARESREWSSRNHTSYLWRDPSWSWQSLYRTSHHKTASWRDHSGFTCLQRLRQDFRCSRVRNCDTPIDITVLKFMCSDLGHGAALPDTIQKKYPYS